MRKILPISLKIAVLSNRLRTMAPMASLAPLRTLADTGAHLHTRLDLVAGVKDDLVAGGQTLQHFSFEAVLQSEFDDPAFDNAACHVEYG